MEHILTVIILAKFVTFFLIFSFASADTYSVKIGTESHVNLVDTKFLSFTIDPKYLFSSSGKYKTKECICMASSLTPAYIRIAGPSTSQTTFHNSTISIDSLKLLDDGNSPQKVSLNEYQREHHNDKFLDELSVTHEDWEQFVQWAKKTGFDLVFALNNEEKTATGIWDPNTALNILTVADKADVGDIFWQLGYACNNQSIEEYLNDLETLRVITETFPSGKAGRWRVVGGDVTPCLVADSKSDFKDYVMLSDEMLDAVFLNGNSSSQELERMSEKDRLKLLKVLSRSNTPLWLTETNRRFHELERAADWMTSLGYSAKNGFSVHFRELVETELYEPTLSFYMALLFKNLVGEKVLSVDMEASDATMFAHCTSLRHKPVPGAVTLYGANMDTEPARFSIKLSKKEEGGDIMQFILGHDHSGNILVNGRAMYYEGDIKPVVKRVRPYKTLLINLPAKSFGFWVLANTQVDACNENDDKTEETQFVEALAIESSEDFNVMKTKRSIDSYDIEFKKKSSDMVQLTNGNIKLDNKALNDRIDELNEGLTTVKKIFSSKNDNDVTSSIKQLNKIKRQVNEKNIQSRIKNKSRRQKNKYRTRKARNNDRNSILKSRLISKLRNNNVGRFSRFDPSSIRKRNSNSRKGQISDSKGKNTIRRASISKKNKTEPHISNPDCDSLRKRKRRSINEENKMEQNMRNKDYDVSHKKYNKFRNIHHNQLEQVSEDVTVENSVGNESPLNEEDKDTIPVGKFLRKLKKLSQFPIEIYEKHEDHDNNELNDDTSNMDEIILKTKFFDDSAIINIKEKSTNGFLRSTIEELLSIVADFNDSLNKFWSALSFLE